MKILLVSASDLFSSYGGGQVYVKNLVDQLIQQGESPIIATPYSDGIRATDYKGCRVINFGVPLTAETTYNILAEIKPDIVHAHGFKAIFAESCRKLDIPCIITAHHGGITCPAGSLLNYRDEICMIRANQNDCLPCVLKNIRGGIWIWPLVRLLPLKLRGYLGKLMKKLPFIYFVTPVLQASYSIRQKELEWSLIHQNASLIIAPSNEIARNMIINGVDAEKIKVVPHGVPLPKNFHNTVVNTPERSFKFFYVGRISYVKGVHVMLAAFNESKINAELHIIGGAGNRNEERYMRRQTKKYKDDARIKWQGKISYQNIYDEINKYDVMIHPAIYLEVFGLNIAEALAMGKPVIATRCGGPEMQIEDGENGWLIPPNDKERLTEKIEFVVKEFPLQTFIGSRTNPTSIEEHCVELQKLYKSIS